MAVYRARCGHVVYPMGYQDAIDRATCRVCVNCKIQERRKKVGLVYTSYMDDESVIHQGSDGIIYDPSTIPDPPARRDDLSLDKLMTHKKRTY